MASKELMLSAPLMGVIAVRDRYEQGTMPARGPHLAASAFAGYRLAEWRRVPAMSRWKWWTARDCWRSRRCELHYWPSLGDAAWQPTFVFYMGYPRWKARASPRRGVEDVVL